MTASLRGLKVGPRMQRAVYIIKKLLQTSDYAIPKFSLYINYVIFASAIN